MSTSIHIPEGLLSFHIGHTGLDSQKQIKCSPVAILLKRVVTDLRQWLNSSWAAGMIPGGAGLVPELKVVCASGDTWRSEVPDLICPIRGNTDSGLAAMVAIGPRNDGAPYSQDDRHLADALCEHIGVLLANEPLALKVSEGLSAMEQIDEDTETARDLYDRLDHCYPPRIPGLEYGGQCHRGGKFTSDFFELLPRGEHDLARNLVVAIGNVAVRGLPGGILLGGTLASVRALVNRGEPLVAIAAELNRTLWEMSPEDAFTSFFCAQIDPARKCVRYVSAGHEPALLLRGRSGHVDRLDPTGAVLGLSRRSSYRERLVAFEPGDLLAAFTDGIAESAGPDGVVRILRDGLAAGVHEMATHVVDAADTAADRTIVIVRANKAEELPEPVEKYALAAA